MNTKIDIKSLLLGAVLAVVVTLGVAAAATKTPTKYVPRFQIAVADGYVFKLDTMTGQIWRAFVSSPDAEFMQANVGK